MPAERERSSCMPFKVNAAGPEKSDSRRCHEQKNLPFSVALQTPPEPKRLAECTRGLDQRR
jgi:hypothetical protein